MTAASTLRSEAQLEGRNVIDQDQEALERELLHQKYPNAIEVTRYIEIGEVFRSTAFAADPEAATLLARDPSGTKKTLHILDGQAHVTRRRTMNRLLRRDGHTWYRDTVLFPTVDRALAEVKRDLDAGRTVRLDWIPFAKSLFVQLAAALVGLEAAESSEGAEQLLGLMKRVDAAHAAPHNPNAEAAIADGLEAKRTFIDQYFAPAYAAHQEIWRQFEAGELQESELPHDLMLLLVAHADPEWADTDLAAREALSMTVAPVSSSVQSAAYTMTDLSRWFVKHPEDYERRTDRAFLLRAFEESLRLHVLGGLMFRQAAQDITLAAGTEFRAGQWAALRLMSGNHDPSVYGQDANEFNPWRAVPPGIAPYGLSFGAGAHMCYGIPIVLGNEGIDGSSVYVLQSLYKLGAEPDPFNPARVEDTIRPEATAFYERYPIVFPGANGLS
jgi:cytochrome P450